MSFFLSNGSPTPLPLSSQDRDLLSTKASPTALREIPEARRLMRSDPVSSRVASILCKGDWPSWGSRTLAACPQRPAGGLGGGGRERAGTAPDSASQGRRPPHEAQTGPPVGPCPAGAADGARRTARPAGRRPLAFALTSAAFRGRGRRRASCSGKVTVEQHTSRFVWGHNLPHCAPRFLTSFGDAEAKSEPRSRLPASPERG